MKHPELIYMAADKLHISPFQLIYEAFAHNDVFLNERGAIRNHNYFVNTGIVVDLVSDYALDVLAGKIVLQHRLKMWIMHNQDGKLRRCLYCGQQFAPINGNASFCCYGHAQMYNRGDVHHDDQVVPFVPNSSFMSVPSFVSRTGLSGVSNPPTAAWKEVIILIQS